MNTFYKMGLMAIALLSVTQLKAQQKTRRDTLKLDTIAVKDTRQKHLANIIGTGIFPGKKTFSITPDAGKANLANNNARMLFAQVPGVNIWEMDGAGLQVNIGTRGTDTHRSIETNMRQNGYNTNSDIFGYPEDHYTPPFQGISEIQIVRGSAALQFGSQFGGMVNYKMKEGDTSKAFSVESNQTAGSNRFFDSYNAVGGKAGKWSYYAYFSTRSGDGWRPDPRLIAPCSAARRNVSRITDSVNCPAFALVRATRVPPLDRHRPSRSQGPLSRPSAQSAGRAAVQARIRSAAGTGRASAAAWPAHSGEKSPSRPVRRGAQRQRPPPTGTPAPRRHRPELAHRRG